MAYLPPAPDVVSTGNSTATTLVSLAVTGASYSGSSLVLTGAWAGGGASAYVGVYFFVSGFTGVAVGNNSPALTSQTTAGLGFICTASSAGSITLTVTGGYNGIAGTPFANQTFIGTATDTTSTPIAKISVTLDTDQNSTAIGLQIQFSSNGTNWDFLVNATVTGGTTAALSSGVYARYFRVVFVPGNVQQTYFRLQTMVSPTPISATTKSLTTAVEGFDSATLTRNVVVGIASIGTPPNPATGTYTQVVTDVYGSQQVVVGGQAADAFGRIRIANPVCLFDAQFQYDSQPTVFQIKSVGGSVTKTAGASSLTLSTGGTTVGNFAVNQSKQYMRYEPGKSQQILMTGTLGVKTANVRSAIGYRDSNDGVYFVMDGTLGACVALRSSVPGVSVGPIPAVAVLAGGASYAVGDTGTISTGGANATYQVLQVTSTGMVTAILLTSAGTGYTTGLGVATATGGGQPGSGTGLTVNIVNEILVQQANWNFDKMDGTGVSGVALNFANAQIFCIDFQWLGVGRVRYGFFVQGALIVCHQTFNANITTTPYMNTANLPCHASIMNTGTAVGATTMTQICMSVNSEGGVDNPTAYQFSASSGAAVTTFATTALRYPLVSIQPKLLFNGITNRSQIKPLSVAVEVLPTSSNPVYWELIYNCTLSGTPSFGSADPNSLVNYDTSAAGTVLTITGLTTSSSVTTITGGWGGGANNQYVGQWITVSGMTGGSGANNGLWLCTASAAGSISWVNAAGTSTHAGTPIAEGKGIVIASGYALTGTITAASLDSKIVAALDIYGFSADTFTLAATGINAGTPGAWGAITWQELR